MTAAQPHHETERVFTHLHEARPGPGPESMLTAIAESQRDLFDFIRMRVEKDGDTLRKVIGCRTWTDTLDVQARWAQEMLQDYNTQMTRMMSVYGARPADNASSGGRHA